VSVDLSGRNEECIMESMTGGTGVAMHEKPAGSRGDVGVDRMNSVRESRDKSIEPVGEGLPTLPASGADLLDCGLNLDKGSHGEVEGIVMCLDPYSGSIAYVRPPLSF
jgi:hypothetical protein